MDNKMTDADARAELNRLRWQCRRGQLELDLILHAFLDQHYAQLTRVEQIAFQRLLRESDQTLREWLMPESNQAEPQDTELRDLVRKLRATA